MSSTSGASAWSDHLSVNGGKTGVGPIKGKSYSQTTGSGFVPTTSSYGPKPQKKEVDFDYEQTAEAASAA